MNSFSSIISKALRSACSNLITACGIFFLILFMCCDKETTDAMTWDVAKDCVTSIWLLLCSFQFTLTAIEKYMWQDVKRRPLDIKITQDYNDKPEAILKKKEQEYNGEVKSSAIHEAGHVIIARHFDIQVKKAVATLEHSYITAVKECKDEKQVKEAVMLHYGGAAAEEIIYGKFGTSSFGQETADFNQAIKFLEMYVVMTDKTISKTSLDPQFNEQMVRYSKEWYQETKKILEENKMLLMELAKALSEKEILFEEEIEEIYKNKQKFCL